MFFFVFCDFFFFFKQKTAYEMVRSDWSSDVCSSDLGAAPAWFATRTNPAEALRGSGRSTSDHSSFARKALLIVQATLSVALVAGATMLARSLNKLEHQDFGYKIQGRVLVDFLRPPASYTPPKLAALYRAVEDRFDRLPGVQGSGLALYNPLTDNWGELILVAGHPAPKLNRS